MSVRIALANIPAATSPADSVERAVSAILDAGRAGASIVCLPEAYVPGYRWYDAPPDSVPAPDATFLEQAWATVGEAARAAAITVILGTERLTASGLQVTACVFNPDGSVQGWQDKGQLDPDEEAVYPSFGQTRRVFTAGALTFGIAICHEGFRYPETVRWAARQGAQVVFHPHVSRAEPGGYRPTTFADPRNSFHEKAVLCRAAENTIFVASVNCASDASPTTSVIANPDGTVRCVQPYGVEGLLVDDLPLAAATGRLAMRCRM